jgi:hypothetical protein
LAGNRTGVKHFMHGFSMPDVTRFSVLTAKLNILLDATNKINWQADIYARMVGNRIAFITTQYLRDPFS